MATWKKLALAGSGSSQTFGGTQTIDETTNHGLVITSLANYKGIELNAIGSGRPAIYFKNANQSTLGSIYGTEGNDLELYATGDIIINSENLTLSLSAQNEGILIKNTHYNSVIDFHRASTATARIQVHEPGAVHTSSFKFYTSDADSSAPNLELGFMIGHDKKLTTYGQTLAVGGTAAAPAYAFTDQASTGMYKPGTSQLYFSVAGTRKVRMEASQIVLEDDVSVNDGLTVGNTLNVTGQSALTANSGNSWRALLVSGAIEFQTSSADSSEKRLTFAPGGASDDGTLTIYKGDGATAGTTIAGGSTTTDKLYVNDEIIHNGDTNNYIGFGTDTQSFYTSGTERFKISDTGFEFKDMPVKVSSTEKLYLDGGSNTYIEEDSADTMIFATGGTTALTIDSSQRIGMGIAPSSKGQLSVYGNGLDSLYVKANDNDAIVVENIGNAPNLILLKTNNGSEAFKVTCGGSNTGNAHLLGNLTITGGQFKTTSGVNLALNPNTGVVTVGGEIQTTSDIIIPATKTIWLDGDGDTGLRETSANNILLFANGVTMANLDGASGTVFNEDGADLDFRIESDAKTHALFVQGSDGLVGINKTPDTYQLDVAGSARFTNTSGHLLNAVGSGNSQFYITATGQVTHTSTTGNTAFTVVQQGSGDICDIAGKLSIAHDGDVSIVGSTNYSQLRIKSAGSEEGIKFINSSSNTDGWVYATGYGLGFLDEGGHWTIKAQNNTGIYFYTNNGSQHMQILNSGNVSIGSTDDNFKLEVGGTTYISGNTVIGRDQALNPKLTISSTAKSSAIGKVDTGMPLSIDSGSSDNTNSVGHLAQIGFGLINAYQPVAIGAKVVDAGVYTKADLVFATRDSTSDIAPTERLVITSGGLVGINKFSGMSKTLHVDSTTGSAGTPNGIMLYNHIHGSDSQIYMYAENDSGTASSGIIKYDPDASTMTIGGSNGTGISINSSGHATFAGNVNIGGSLVVSGDTGNGSYLGHINNTGSQSEDNGLHIQIASSGSGAHGLKVQTGGSANAFIVSGDGKVGLGYSSSSMTEIFNVNGNAAFGGDVISGRFIVGVGSQPYLTQGGANSLKIDTGDGYLELGPMNSTYCHIYTDRAAGTFFDKDINLENTRSLNVGGYGQYTTVISQDGATIGGDVGIGTASPGSILHAVQANDGAATEFILDNSAAAGSTDETVAIRLRHAGATGAKIFSERTEDFASSGAQSANLCLQTTKDGVTATRMVVADSGTTSFYGNTGVSADSKYLRVGHGNDYTMMHDGTHTYVENSTGELRIYQSSTDWYSIWTKPSGGSTTRRLSISPNGSVTIGATSLGDITETTADLIITDAVESSLYFNDTGAASGKKTGRWVFEEGIMKYQPMNDAGTSSSFSALQINELGYSTFGGAYLNINAGGTNSAITTDSDTMHFIADSNANGGHNPFEWWHNSATIDGGTKIMHLSNSADLWIGNDLTVTGSITSGTINGLYINAGGIGDADSSGNQRIGGEGRTNLGGYIRSYGGNNGGKLEIYSGTSGAGTLAVTIASDQSATFSNTVTLNGHKFYTTTIANFDADEWFHACKVTGDQLTNVIKMTLKGVSSSGHLHSHVIDIMVSHYQDIQLKSWNGDYSQLKIKIVSDGNENFDVFLKKATTGTYNHDMTLEVNIQALTSTTTVEFGSEGGYSANTLEHTTTAGQSNAGLDGSSYGKSHHTQDGRMNVGSGALATPAYSFKDDTDTGMFRTEANGLAFATGGTQALSINSSQTAIFSGDLYIPANIVHSGDSNNYIGFQTDRQDFVTDGTTALTIDSSQHAMFYGQLSVYSGSLVVKAANDTAAYVYIQADNNDNNADNWRLSAETDGMFDIQSKESGSWASVVEWGGSDKAMYAKGNVHLSGTTLSLAGTSSVDSYLRFDGSGGDTYLHYNANDMIDVYTGGDIAMRIKDDDVEFNGAISTSGRIEGKYLVTFIHNFSDDIGTTEHAIPWAGTGEQTNANASQVAYMAPFAMTLKKIILRPETISNAAATFKIFLKKQDDGDTTDDTVATQTSAGSHGNNTAFTLSEAGFSATPSVGALDKVSLHIKASVDPSSTIDWYITSVWEVTQEL